MLTTKFCHFDIPLSNEKPISYCTTFTLKNMNHMKIYSQGSLDITKALASAHPEPGTMKRKRE
jgi:hypothetical protein